MAAQTPPPITPVPTPVPQRGDRATFSSRVDAFVTWLINAVTQFGAVATNVYNNALDAFNSAVAAAGSANTASAAAQSAVATPSTAATSTTSLQLGYGSKTLTLAQTNKTFQIGQWVVAAETAQPRNSMAGPVTAFTPGTGVITINVQNVTNNTTGVFPTIAAWTVSLTGPAAQTSQQQALSFVPVPMAALDMDLSQGEWFKKTIAGNSTFTWSNVPQPPYGKAWVLELTITSGLVGFPASVRWAGGLTPTLLAGKTHLVVFSTTNGGTDVHAAVLAGYAS
jgi:hypothetical protein